MAGKPGEESGDWTLHGILSPSDPIKRNIWYVVPTHDGEEDKGGEELPGPRLGHASVAVPKTNAFYILQGASPDGTLADVIHMDLGTFQWKRVKSKGLAPSGRYEHTALLKEETMQIFVIFGAEQERNLNDVYIFDIATSEWRKPITRGASPSPRTLHNSAVMVHGQVYVFGGGDKGMSPVEDNKLHVLNTETLQWSQPHTSGTPPSHRLGHTLCAVGEDVFVFGGMAGTDVFADLHKLDSKTLTWSRVATKGSAPSARSGHAACVIGTRMYVCGGLGLTMAGPVTYDDIFCLDTATSTWTQLEPQSAPPSARLDHTMVAVTFGALEQRLAAVCVSGPSAPGVKKPAQASSGIQDVTEMFGIGDSRHPEAPIAPIPREEHTQPLSDAQPSTRGESGGAEAPVSGMEEERRGEEDEGRDAGEEGATAECLLVFGGMDTMGNIFNDCVLLRP